MNRFASLRRSIQCSAAVACLVLVEGVSLAKSPSVAIAVHAPESFVLQPVQGSGGSGSRPAGQSATRSHVCHISHHKAVLERTCPLVVADVGEPIGRAAPELPAAPPGA